MEALNCMHRENQSLYCPANVRHLTMGQ